MLLVALRDVQWRKRRLSSQSLAPAYFRDDACSDRLNGVSVEAERTVDSMGVDALRSRPAAGPFCSDTIRPNRPAPGCSPAPGVRLAAPLATAPSTIRQGTSARNVTAFGAPEHGPGMPHLDGAIDAGTRSRCR